MSDIDELRKSIAEALGIDMVGGEIEPVIRLITQSYAKDYAEYEKLGLIDRLNKEMFYSETNPSGQHIKNCLMAEHDALQPIPPGQLEQIEYGKFRRLEQRERIK